MGIICGIYGKQTVREDTGMKVLVTGSKGQLGTDVINELERRGMTAIGVDIE